MPRRGFTLMEMLIVCAVLGMIAGMVYPNVVAMKAGREKEEAYNAVLRLAQQGHEVAIQSGHTYTLSLNGTSLSLDRAEETELSRDGQSSSGTTTDTTSTTTSVKTGLPTSVVGSGAGVSGGGGTGALTGQDADGASVNLPDGASVGNVVLDGKTSSASDFTLHFYPDGRSEGGGFEIEDGVAVRSLQVDRFGLATLQPGNLPDTAETNWEAGQYEQRASG